MASVVLEKEITRFAERVQQYPETSYTKEVCETEERTVTKWKKDEDGEYYLFTETEYETVCRTIEVTEGPEFTYEWTTDLNKGWNAGARTIERVDGDFYFSFGVNPANRLGVGVGRDRRSNDYRHIPYAFYFNGDDLRVVELGVVKYGPVKFSRHDLFSIVRIGDEVVYKQNHNVVYRSQKPSSGSMIGIAAIYMGGDRVL